LLISTHLLDLLLKYKMISIGLLSIENSTSKLAQACPILHISFLFIYPVHSTLEPVLFFFLFLLGVDLVDNFCHVLLVCEAIGELAFPHEDIRSCVAVNSQ
jgi:hypothetical protein